MSVNLPEVSLDRIQQGTRLLHLHRNVPGVMATVNSVLGEHGVNIDSQQLATRGGYGYVVTDCTNGVPEAALEQIRGLDATTRLTALQA